MRHHETLNRPPVRRAKRRAAAVKKWVIPALLVAMLCAGLAASGAQADDAARMERDELKARLDRPEVVIIDVRSYTDWLFSGEKIKGAVRENYRDFDGWYARYPKEKTIVLYCA
jgi:hypothetical protein